MAIRPSMALSLMNLLCLLLVMKMVLVLLLFLLLLCVIKMSVNECVQWLRKVCHDIPSTATGVAKTITNTTATTVTATTATLGNERR